MEPKKPLISNALWDIVSWHKWAIISIGWSTFLIYLNLVEYAIGGEIGTSATQKANFLGALQLIIKAHELTLACSLFVVAQQWLQRALLDFDTGMPLGLLGAENEIGRPSFLISKGYVAAVCYASNLWPSRNPNTPEDLRRKRHVSVTAIFLFAACVITSLAGPASGVLMIPRVDWFSDMALNFTSTTPSNYPALLPTQRSGPEALLFNWTGTIELGLPYWNEFAMFRSPPPAESGHRFDDPIGPVHINTSTTLGRALDGYWDGGTNATTVMRWDIMNALMSALTAQPIGSDEVEFGMFERYHVGALTQWLGRNVPDRDSGATARVSPNLNLLAEAYVTRIEEIVRIDRVYMTEGPLTQHYTNYSDSIEVVFDGGTIERKSIPRGIIEHEAYLDIQTGTPTVTVCSISLSIIPALISSTEFPFLFRYAEYKENAGRKLRFHKDWLLNTRRLLPDTRSSEGEPVVNITHLTSNPILQDFGMAVLPNFDEDKTVNGFEKIDDAANQEIVVAVAFEYIMSLMEPSISQYSTGSVKDLPADSMPETPPSYPGTPTRVIRVFNLGYGFRLSTRTSILGITVLLAHAVIVVLSSLWQLFWERKIILGWGTIPDYVALALGSDFPVELKNTCAGISYPATLQTVVKVGETTKEHLEIAFIERRLDMKPASSRFGDKYGSHSAGGKSQEKLE